MVLGLARITYNDLDMVDDNSQRLFLATFHNTKKLESLADGSSCLAYSISSSNYARVSKTPEIRDGSN
jgi:hypothetical protein